MSYHIADMEHNKFTHLRENVTAVNMVPADSPASDAFSRLMVSSPITVFDNFETTVQKTYAWSEATSGGASIAYVSNTAATKFETSAASGDKATRSSKKLCEYVPGTSLLILNTGVLGAGAANSHQRIGLFDDQNGVFFDQVDGVLGVTIRSYTTGTAVDTHITKASWNIDKMDGTGVSGVTIDTTKSNIFIIDLQWLGVGRVRFGFDIDGMIFWCHEVNNANTRNVVYMSTPRLPIRYEVENTGASSALDDFRQICSTAIAEGVFGSNYFPRSINNGVIPIATSTTKKPIISMQLKSAFVNKANIRITNVSPSSTSKSETLFEVYLNPTLTGASFADVDGIARRDVTASAVTGGTRIASFYATDATKAPLAAFKNQFVLGSDLAGTSDIFTVTAQTVTGTDTSLCAVDYDELY